MRSIRALLLAGVVVAGCSSKPLQGRDASGGGGVGVVSIDAATDSTPSIDVAPDLPADAGLPFTGRRSFVITSMLGQDGGSTVPASHVFTLVLDADQRIVNAADRGEGYVAGIEPTVTGGVHVVGSLAFRLAVGCSASVLYQDLTFALDPIGNLTGTGHGQVTIYASDVGMTTNVTMSLTGVPDTEAPGLTVTADGELADPFTSFVLVASEPLLPGANVLLAAASGEAIPLPSNTPGLGFVTQFSKPFTMLRYGERYLITTDLTDLAGNVAIGDLQTFTTAAPPPIAAEDGFESLTDATFGGAQVLSRPDSVLTGTRSLYVPPGTTAPAAARSLLLVLRVPLTPGDTAIRFSYRTVGSGDGANFLLGTTGGKILLPTLPPDSTTVPTPGTIAGSTVSLGPLMTATFALPAGADGEAVFRRSVLEAPCGFPARPVPGIIIDDLRAE